MTAFQVACVSLRFIRPRLGELVLAGFAGQAVPSELRAVAREFGLGGLLLGAGNVADLLQVADLVRDAGTLAREVPLWLAPQLDDDPLVPLRPPLVGWPPARTLGRADDLALTRAYATALARQARAVGLTLLFAPVVDVDAGAEAVRTADGLLASDPQRVARHAAVVVEACAAVGLATCARHFPGLGGAAVVASDTPGGAPLVETAPDHFARVAWLPFHAVREAGVGGILVAHVFAPALDERQPAAWSSTIVEGLLRRSLPWPGAVMSDDLARMPVTTDDPLEHPAVRALRAGCDVLLHGDPDADRLVRALECVVHAAEQQELPIARLEDALRRHDTMKAATLSLAARRRQPPPPTLEAVLRGEDERVAARMREFS